MANPIAITALDAGSVKATDVYPAVDVTDQSQALSGTTKKYTIAQLQTYLGFDGTGWNNVIGISQSMTPDGQYIANNAVLVTFMLPIAAPFGTILQVAGLGAGGWIIEQNANQNIQVGNASSSIGIGGSIASTNQYDAISLVCAADNTTWITLNMMGDLTIV